MSKILTATYIPETVLAPRRNGSSWNDAVTGDGDACATSSTILEQAVYSTNHVLHRLFMRFDTRTFPKDVKITSAELKIYFGDGRRGTSTGVNIWKLSGQILGTGELADNNDYFQTIDNNVLSDTSIDILGTGEAAQWFTFPVDGDLLTSLRSSLYPGDEVSKFEIFARPSTDYDNDNVADPTLVNYREINFTNTNPETYVYNPVLKIFYKSPEIKIKSGKVTLKSGKLSIK